MISQTTTVRHFIILLNNLYRFLFLIEQLLAHLQINGIKKHFKAYQIMLPLGHASQKRVPYSSVPISSLCPRCRISLGCCEGAETSKQLLVCGRTSIFFKIYHGVCRVLLKQQAFFMSLCIPLVCTSKGRNHGSRKALGANPPFPFQPMYVCAWQPSPCQWHTSFYKLSIKGCPDLSSTSVT